MQTNYSIEAHESNSLLIERLFFLLNITYETSSNMHTQSVTLTATSMMFTKRYEFKTREQNIKHIKQTLKNSNIWCKLNIEIIFKENG